MASYSLRYLANLMNLAFDDDIPITGVCVDSRLAKPGDLFFALPGAKVDGHQFISEAFSKGAVAAVVKKGFTEIYGRQFIHVDDVLEALQLAAKNLLTSRHPRIVAITGSLGKTTTKDFITNLLRPKYRVSASPGNSNSQIGIPLAILNHTNGEEDILILEMGMTHPGNLAKLVEIAPPEIALITTTAFVHACNFADLDEIGRTKAEIFSHPKTRLGILDRNIKNFEELQHIGSCRKVSFAVDNPQADYCLYQTRDGMIVKDMDETIFLDLLPLPGKHNLHNFLAAATLARHLGISWDEIRAALPALTLPERRLQFIEKEGVLFVNDAYNAALNSVKAALESLPSPRPGGKRIAVLGEMAELGRLSEQSHRELGEFSLKYVDRMLCFGKDCKYVWEAWEKAGRTAEWHSERSGVVTALRRIIQPGDVVLLKGSRVKEVWKVLDEL